MCDFSLKAVRSRSARVGDKLETHNFGYGTLGFADPASLEYCAPSEHEAVCVLPGTEISFSENIRTRPTSGFYYTSEPREIESKVAIFRQINKDQEHTHHDALEIPGGEVILLNALLAGQMATVLQLPAAPKNETEAKEQERIPYNEGMAFVG